MKRKNLTHTNCVTFGLYMSDNQNKTFTKIFNLMTDYKNGYIKSVWKQLNEYAEQDEQFKNSLYLVQNQNKLYGKTVNKEELDEQVTEAYLYLGSLLYKKEGENRPTISLSEMKKNYMKNASRKYNIWLADDMRDYALTNVNTGFQRLMSIKFRGQNVQCKTYDKLLSIQSKPIYSKKKDGSINIDEQGSLRITYIDNEPYLKICDYSNSGMKHIFDVYDEENDIFTTKSGYKPNCKWTYLRLHYNKKDDLQRQIIENNYIGCTKLSRIYKKGKWRYFVQINFEHLSPIIANMNFENHKVAINVNTEMVAIVRDDGLQDIIERTPNTPRTVEEIDVLAQKMDNSRKALNPNLYKEDGQIKYTKKEMKELGLNWELSNNYKRYKKERKELYRLLSDERKRNNEILAKYIIQLGNEFVIDNNEFKAWQMKINRMSKGSQKRFDNGIRKSNDYADQIQNTAPGMFTARVEDICKQSQLPLIKLSTFSSSTYNHYTQAFDIFLKLNQRFLTFKKQENYVSDEIYNETAVQFINTLNIIEKDNKRCLVQRDVYAASKMLFITQKQKTITTKNGYKKEITVDVFDQENYSKWFDEVFYPKHIEFIKDYIKKYNLDIDINGLILGTHK